MNIGDIIQRERAGGFPNLRGARIYARIPLREALLREMAASATRSGGTLQRLSVSLPGGNAVAITASVKKGFLSLDVPVTLEIEPEIRLSPTPLFVARLHVGGAFGFVLDQAIGVAPLPPFVRIQNRVLTVDLRPPLTDAGLGDLLPFLRRLRIENERGALILVFEAEVP